MGGTGVALATDGTGPFVNPATITRVSDTRIAFSVNLYSLQINRLNSWLQPGPVDRARFGEVPTEGTSGTDVELHGLPSTLCFFLFSGPGDVGAAPEAGIDKTNTKAPATSLPTPKPNPHQAALCFGTIQRQSFAIVDSTIRPGPGGFAARQSSAMGVAWSRFAIGPSFATRLGDKWSLGVSLHGHVDVYHATWTGSVFTTTPGAASAVTASLDDDSRGASFDLAALIGATYHDGPFTFGASANLPSVHVYGRAHANRFSQFADASATTSSATKLDGALITRTPLELHVGAAMEWTRTTLELDGTLSLPMGRSYEANVDGSRADRTGGAVSTTPLHVTDFAPSAMVANAALGGEHFVSPRFSVLAGLNTDFSAAPSSELGTPHAFYYVTDRRQHLGASLGLGSYGRSGELLFGLDTSYGWGDRLAANVYQTTPTLVPTSHSDVTITLVVAGSTSGRTIKRAYDDVKTIVGAPPAPDSPKPEDEKRLAPASLRSRRPSA